MGVASIKFVQGANAPPAGQALQGVTGTAVTCSNADDTNINSHTWILEQVPPNSALVPGLLGSTATVAFTPDVSGSFLVSLSTTDTFHIVATDERAVCVPQDNVYNRIIPPFSAAGSAVNIGGQLRGWAAFLEPYLFLLDRIRDWSPTAPSNGFVPIWNSTNKRYEPGTFSSFTPGGDLGGTSSSQLVIGFDGTLLDTTMSGPADGSLIQKAAGKWAAVTPASLRGSTGYINGTLQFTTNQTSFITAATIKLDRSTLPATSALKLKVIVETTGPQVTVQLYNVTTASVVTGSTLTSTSTTPVELITADLTPNLSAGDAIYQVQIKMAAGSSADMVALDLARFEATWA